MFNSSSKAPKKAEEVGTAHIETIIGESTTLEGTLQSGGALRIDGHFTGEIATQSDVIIGEKGAVTGNIQARYLLCGGVITGNATITEKIEIAASGAIKGDIHTKTLVIIEGGRLDGNCVMTESVQQAPAEETAAEATA